MKRHYVTIEVTVYAEGDEDAIRKSETLCKAIHQDFAYEPEVKEILEHRFHGFFNRKIDYHRIKEKLEKNEKRRQTNLPNINATSWRQ